MLFTKFDLADPIVFEKFELARNDHEASWKHYYENYNNAFYSIIKVGLTTNYEFNCRAHALMFLLRHILELNLKYNLSLKGKETPLTHDLIELKKAFDASDIPSNYSEVIETFKDDPDGSCWRYHINPNNKTPYFANQETVELAKLIKLLNSNVTTSNGIQYSAISESFDYDNKSTKWDLTLHLSQCQSDWQIKSEFDFAISLLVENIQKGKVEFKNVYLPLLFFIRHAIELALKRNITEVQKVSLEIKQKDLSKEHSLCTLYNVYKTFLDQLDLSQLDQSTFNQYNEYRNAYDKLNDALHQLDNHSRAFRYPIDKDRNPHSINLDRTKIKEIISLYYLTDPFLTFINTVLIENGLLDFIPEN